MSRPKWPIVRAHGVAVHSHFVPVARTMRASTDPDRDQALGMPPPDALRIVRAALACQRRACSRRGDKGAGRQVAVGGVASGHDEVPAAGRPAIIGERKGRDRQARTALAPRAVKGGSQARAQGRCRAAHGRRAPWLDGRSPSAGWTRCHRQYQTDRYASHRSLLTARPGGGGYRTWCVQLPNPKCGVRSDAWTGDGRWVLTRQVPEHFLASTSAACGSSVWAMAGATLDGGSFEVPRK